MPVFNNASWSKIRIYRCTCGTARSQPARFKQAGGCSLNHTRSARYDVMVTGTANISTDQLQSGYKPKLTIRNFYEYCLCVLHIFISSIQNIPCRADNKSWGKLISGHLSIAWQLPGCNPQLKWQHPPMYYMMLCVPISRLSDRWFS
jgi:hypothetical protein